MDTLPENRIKIHRIVWCGAAEPVLSDFGRDHRLLEMAGQLLGSRSMNQLIDQAHSKLPGDGVAFPWHQDSAHLDIPPDGTLPSWLDPATAVPATMRAGSVLLFGPYSIHGSRPNTSSRPRRTFINGFAYPGANARAYPGEGAGRLLSCETDPRDERELRRHAS